MAQDLAIIKSFFKKNPEHLVTYKSGRHSTQIDAILTNRVKNCKVIPGERLVVMDMIFCKIFNIKPERVPKITK